MIKEVYYNIRHPDSPLNQKHKCMFESIRKLIPQFLVLLLFTSPTASVNKPNFLFYIQKLQNITWNMIKVIKNGFYAGDL